jgi:serine/threonine protein kinase
MKQQIVGNYILEEVLGGSFNSTTYKGRDKKGDFVCVKEFNLSKAANWKSSELFEREATTLKKLDHQRIPKFIDYVTQNGENNNSQYFVMEYVEGNSLADKLQNEGVLPQSEVVKIAYEVIDVLGYLHLQETPVVHRDIKPSNLILNEEGEVVLVDFGSVQDKLTAEIGGSTIAGTYGYAPLEIYSGQSFPKSDIYALGMTMFELLTGEKPSSRVDYDKKYLEIGKKELSDRRLRQLLQGMTAKNLDKRLSLDEVRSRLSDLQNKSLVKHRSWKDGYSAVKKYFLKDKKEVRNFELTVLGSMSTVKGVKLGVYTGVSKSVHGINAGIVSEVRGDVNGVNAGSLLSFVDGDVRGINAGSLLSFADNVRGVNAGGLFSSAENVNGVNVGLVSFAGDIRGVNAGGLLSFADNVRGVNAGGLVSFVECNVRGVNVGMLSGAYNVRGVNAGLTSVADNVRGVNAGLLSGAGNVHGVNAGLVSFADNVRGVNAGGLVSFVGGNVRGVNAGGLFSFADNVNGVNAGGIVSFVGGNVRGVNAGLISGAGNVNGVNAGGIFSFVGGNVRGVNAGLISGAGNVSGVNAGLISVAGNVHGVNAGLVNLVMKEMKGLQVGLINYAKDGDNVQLGLLNLSGDEVWYKKKASLLIGINKKKEE